MSADRRQHAPATLRNRGPILESLRKALGAGETKRILEIASGTGEHAAHFCALEPHWIWTPSDPDPDRRESVSSWALHLLLRNLQTPLDIDVIADAAPPAVEAFDAVYCANLIHIAPWSACEGLADLAVHALKPAGRLCLYGPFFMQDIEPAPSNVAFDASLRAKNPDWGVRRLEDVMAAAAARDFTLETVEDMPANNLFVSFIKPAGPPA